MDKKRSAFIARADQVDTEKYKPNETLKKARRDYGDLQSSSHTQYFERKKYNKIYKRITTDEYVGESQPRSSSSDTCPKQYSGQKLIERKFRKCLDPIITNDEWTEECPALSDGELANTLEFLVRDPVGQNQTYRIQQNIRDLVKMSRLGYNIEVLPSLSMVLEYLVENTKDASWPRQYAALLIDNVNKPIRLNHASEITTEFGKLKNFIEFLGYLLLRVGEGELFDIVSRGLVWQLSAPRDREGGVVLAQHVIIATLALLPTVARMLALARASQFPAYQHIALLLAFDSVQNCIELIHENIIENILYRFNPYFPDDLPSYESTPENLHDINLKLGESSVYMSTTLSLLLVLLKTLKIYLDGNPEERARLPIPAYCAQRCFIWAYRYECRARVHRHQRCVLTVIAHTLLYCFGDSLKAFSTLLMPDVLSLAVKTEVPLRLDWTSTVSFNTTQADAYFKRLLIIFSVDLVKLFRYNSFMAETQHWLLGLMFLIDPELCSLRSPWSPPLYAELRKTTLQALVSALPLLPQRLLREYDIIRRIMWYIEWYPESPYDLPTLYWCMRVLQVTTESSPAAVGDLFDTHGPIILTRLLYTLMDQRSPPVERAQAVLSLGASVVTRAASRHQRLHCVVYPVLEWPSCLNSLVSCMLDIVLYSRQNNLLISDRWLVSLLNFIWEAILWTKESRVIFVARNGVYNLLDIITLSSAPVQCMALALVCEVAQAGEAVSQLVTWRAPLAASAAHPTVVRRGATIATLLAAVFRHECVATGVRLNEHGIIEDMENSLMSTEVREEIKNIDLDIKNVYAPPCLPAAYIAGSRMSKAFALLQLLSEDLAHKVAVADDSYNLYKNIPLKIMDEIILVLCSHYLTFKINETWAETRIRSLYVTDEDIRILDEFSELNTGWAKAVKQQQEDALEQHHKRERGEERSLYSFLRRVRLNTALDALHELHMRCVPHSAQHHHQCDHCNY